MVFGSGLVGGAIADAVLISGYRQIAEMPFAWHSADERRVQSHAIAQAALQASGNTDASSLDIVWAAGRAGFASTQEETEQELAAFHDVVSLAKHLAEQDPGRHITFHLMSSAGGLFEDQLGVTAESVPSPKRPYGEQKLRQEQQLLSSPAAMATLIYRPSSVYGFGGAGSRLGLVGTLIRNLTCHAVTRLAGRADTVRDYVLAADVGRFVAAQIGRRHQDSRVMLLASGKPTATFQIIHLVEGIFGRKAYVQFDNRPSNAGSNSFSPHAVPEGWTATDLAYGIEDTARRMYQAASAKSAFLGL